MNVAERNRKVAGCIPIVESIGRSLHISGDALDDCLQAGHLAVIQAIEKYDPETSWDAFVHGWLKLSVARDMLREKHKAQTEAGRLAADGYRGLSLEDVDWHDSEDGSMGDSSWAAELLVNDGNTDLDRSILRDRLVDAICELPADDCAGSARSEILFGVLEGHTVSEIGRRLGISQSTADRLFQHGVALLREKLSDEDGYRITG